MARFGPPTTTWAKNETITWLYGDRWDPIAESYAREVYLVFAGGRVTKAWVDFP